jgi:putative restriction endonuclease
MQAYVGITDRHWFECLRSIPKLDEVNFWQPSGNREFRAIQPGELFLLNCTAHIILLSAAGFLYILAYYQ